MHSARALRACLLLLLVVSLLQAQTNAPRSYSSKGKTINYKLTVFSPPIPVRPDPDRLNQNTAVNCTTLFMARLHHGDLAGAAALTTDPAGTLMAYQSAKTRLGEAKFSQQMNNLFNGDRYRFELTEGQDHLLIGEKDPNRAWAAVEKDGKFWVDRQKFQHESQEYLDLFVLVNDHAAGKLEFK